jgi:CHAT domain-containing protein
MSGQFANLPKIKTEISHVADIAQRAGAHHHTVSQTGATTQQVGEVLESVSIMNMAFHGSQSATEPFQSAFEFSPQPRQRPHGVRSGKAWPQARPPRIPERV